MDTLGGSSAGLRNSRNTSKPAADRWLYWSRKKRIDKNTSLTSESTTLSPCQVLRVAGECDKMQVRGGKVELRAAGLQESQRKAKASAGEGGKSCLIISSSTTGIGGRMQSGKASNSPSSPEAGASARLGVTLTMAGLKVTSVSHICNICE